ncbi:MAG: heme exporter protein CcmB [Alicyclobacillus sp.]|nr:heme exporter protein CcmB [Alicyclobacillus sp.]
MQVFWTLVWKDLRAEMRGGRFVVSCLSFGVLMVLIVGMALNAAPHLPASWASGLLWMVLFFTTALAMTRHDAKEQEFGGWMGPWLAPIDRSLVFYARWCAAWFMVLVASVGLIALFFIILNVPFPVAFGTFVAVVAAGTLALSGAGTLLATLAGQSSLREVLVPILLFPISIPLFLALIRLTWHALDPAVIAGAAWVEIVGAYLVVVGVLPWLLYELILEV